MHSLSSRERKLVAILVLSGLLGLIWLIFVRPVTSGFAERDDRRVQLTRQFQTNQRTMGSIPRLRRLSERQRDGLRNFVIFARTPAEATALLQRRVQSTIEAGGGEMRLIEDSSSEVTQVRVRASARLSLKQITDALARLENETPYLAVESLEIASDQAVVSGRMDVMEVGFEVSIPVILSK